MRTNTAKHKVTSPPLAIFATLPESKQVVLASYDIAPELGSKILLNAVDSIRSPFDGKKIKVAASAKKITITDLSKYPVLATCGNPKCGCQMRVPASVADKLAKSEAHCMVCGNELVLAAEADEDVDLSGDDDTADDSADDEDVAADSDASDEEEVNLDDDSSDDSSDTDDTVAEDDTADEEATSDDDDAAEVDPDAMDDDAGDDDVTEDDSGSADEDVTSDDDATDDDTADPEDEESTAVTASINMLKMAGLNLKHVDDYRHLQLAYTTVAQGAPAGESIRLVLLRNQPIATMHCDKASADIRKMWPNVDQLRSALVLAMQNGGVDGEVVANFGLEPITVDFESDAALAQEIAKLRADSDATIKRAVEQAAAVYEQSFGIAVTGLNKGLYKDLAHPLRDALVRELAAVGVEKPRRLIDKAFDSAGIEYLQIVSAKAMEITGRSEEVRDTMAQHVEEASYNYGSDEVENTAFVRENLRQPAREVKDTVETASGNPDKSGNQYSRLFPTTRRLAVVG